MRKRLYGDRGWPSDGRPSTPPAANANARTPHHRSAYRVQWAALDVRAGGRIFAPGPAVAAGQQGGARRRARDGAGVRPRQVPVDRADRDYAGRCPLRRVFRRDTRAAADAVADRARLAGFGSGHSGCRHRRDDHHLRDADRRRTGPEASRPARSRKHRGQGCSGAGLARQAFTAAGGAARLLGQAHSDPARAERRGRGEGFGG